MSEPSGIQVPAEPSFDNAAFQGSLQQLLQDNIGAFVTIAEPDLQVLARHQLHGHPTGAAIRGGYQLRGAL